MALNDYDQFRGVTHIRRDNYSQNLLYSTIDWLKWSSLQVGGFQNVAYSNASGILGGNFSRLRMTTNPNYTDGQTWEGFQADWVWETGISYVTQPTFCSGVFVDSVFYPTSTTSGTYAHHVNFPLGRIVFDTAIATSATVEANFAHRTISYARATDPWFREILFDSYSIERSDRLVEGSGQWDQLSQMRRHMPVVGVELAARRYEGYELGSAQHYVYQDVVMYVLAESEDERNQIIDIISQQNNKTIWLYNRGRAKESATYPYDLDIYGSPVASPLQFPQLVAATGDGGHRYKTATLGDCRITGMSLINSIYRGILRTTFESII